MSASLHNGRKKSGILRRCEAAVARVKEIYAVQRAWRALNGYAHALRPHIMWVEARQRPVTRRHKVMRAILVHCRPDEWVKARLHPSRHQIKIVRKQ